MKQDKNFSRKLAFKFSLIVFFIIFIAFNVAGTTIVLLYKLELITEFIKPTPLNIIVFIAILSIIIGASITAIISRFPLKPFRELITATKELANGNFQARIQLDSSFRPHELHELSNYFNHMAEALGSIEILRTDFINNFSHEFKTPIASLCGFAKLLKKNNLSPEERNEYLDIIIYEANRLLLLATNVLNLSKIEQHTINQDNKTFHLTEQIRRTIVLFESKWMEKELSLTVELDEILFYGNEELINQIWVNVLDNAIKFSPQGTEIQIKLEDYYDNIVFKVKDHGCGMDTKTQKHLFDKFYQGDTSHATEGNGLGLTIVQKIISFYQGIVTVESEINEGTTVTIVLPKQ